MAGGYLKLLKRVENHTGAGGYVQEALSTMYTKDVDCILRLSYRFITVAPVGSKVIEPLRLCFFQ
ncbi:hypothetical protein D3C73_1418250 [compost metagenome]